MHKIFYNTVNWILVTVHFQISMLLFQFSDEHAACAKNIKPYWLM